MRIDQLKPNITVRGTIFPEPVQVNLYDRRANPSIHPINDPVRLGWEPLVQIEHYHIKADIILRSESE